MPPAPNPPKLVNDYVGLLSGGEVQALEQKLVAYDDSTSTQIAIVIEQSLEGDDAFGYSQKLAQTWGIGQAKEDNGVIILVAKAERKIAINPGYGLEDRLTAGIGGEIIRNIIIPEFKAGSYYQGLNKGADALFDVFKGKYKGERKQNKKSNFPILPFIIIIVIILVLLSKNKKGGGGNSGNSGGNPSLLDMIILSNLGRSGGGGFGGGGFGGSSGGGGFGGGFGGGGFSGGGSSGGW